MAINGLVFAGSETRVGFSEESTFGTAIADGGAFTALEADLPTGIDMGVFQEIGVKNTNSRVAQNDMDFTTTAGGLRVVNVSNIKCRRTDIAPLLYAVMQNVSESATTPYTKTFTWDGSEGTPTTQPDFSSNAGYFATLGVRGPIASKHYKFTSAIVRSLELSASMTGGDGRLMANAEFISGFAPSVTANYSGTWSYTTQNYFNFSNMTTKTLGGSDVVVYDFSLKLDNKAVRVGNNSSGHAETYGVGIPEYELTGSITLKYDANSLPAIANFLSGTTAALQLAVGSAGSAGHLDFTMPAIITTGPSMDYGRAEGQAITIPFKALYDAGGNPLITITLSDGNDFAW